MPQIEWIEVAVGGYPMIKNGKKKTVQKPIIFIIAKDVVLHEEVFMYHDPEVLNDLIMAMLKGKNVNFTLGRNVKPRYVRKKNDETKTIKSPFRLATAFTVDP